MGYLTFNSCRTSDQPIEKNGFLLPLQDANHILEIPLVPYFLLKYIVIHSIECFRQSTEIPNIIITIQILSGFFRYAD